MKHYFQRVHVLLATLILLTISCSSSKVNTTNFDKAIISIETGFTILKVRTAQKDNQSYIVASSYEGTLLGVSYDGKTLWKNELSGFLNHDIYIRDIDNDGNDEILAANADGTIYCLNADGKLRWKFSKNTAPMFAVSAIKKDDKTYIVAGGFDNHIYYISAKGKFIKKINPTTYSKEKLRKNNGKKLPKSNLSMSNFIRTIKKPDEKKH